ncbi:nucleoid DNA-binding protein [Methylobacterium sp. BE186]|nr:nucleoid DNA-binding protein [Methylobacterium sp. BE186]
MNEILGRIEDALAAEDRVEIRGFGVCTTKCGATRFRSNAWPSVLFDQAANATLLFN